MLGAEFLTDVDSLLHEELKMCKNLLFYLTGLYSKFSELQKCLQGNDVTIIQALTIVIGFQVKIGWFTDMSRV